MNVYRFFSKPIMQHWKLNGSCERVLKRPIRACISIPTIWSTHIHIHADKVYCAASRPSSQQVNIKTQPLLLRPHQRERKRKRWIKGGKREWNEHECGRKKEIKQTCRSDVNLKQKMRGQISDKRWVQQTLHLYLFINLLSSKAIYK